MVIRQIKIPDAFLDTLKSITSCFTEKICIKLRKPQQLLYKLCWIWLPLLLLFFVVKARRVLYITSIKKDINSFWLLLFRRQKMFHWLLLCSFAYEKSTKSKCQKSDIAKKIIYVFIKVLKQNCKISYNFLLF